MLLVKTEDATTDQIREFCRINHLEVSEKDGRDDLLGALALAKIPTHTIYVDAEAPPVGVTEAATLREYDGSPETERWVRIRIQPDPFCSDQNSPVFASDNEKYYYLRRGVPIVIPERFYQILRDAKEVRTQQEMDTDGQPRQRMQDARRVEYERYPMMFYGTHGFVREGPPRQVPEDTIVYRM